MGGHAVKELSAKDVTLPADSGWRKLPILGAILAVIGIAGTFAIGGEDHAHHWSWIIAVMYWVSIAIGATFFTVIFSLTRAEWHIAARKPAEAMMGTLPFLLLLLVPMLFGEGFAHVFAWADPHALETDPILQRKAPYLNQGFFTARFFVYVAIMAGVSWFFRLQLQKQDETGDHAISRRLRAMAAPALALLALSTTFLSFDWMMSTDYHWFSTIYGIIYFAGGFMGFFAVMAIMLISLRGSMGGAVTQHHFHGTGKMMFGLCIFWAYTSFSQFMLIWYGNIPEETLWYAHRWSNGWKPFSVLLFVCHFAIPLFALMSRHVKREPRTLFLGAVWLLVWHYVDLFWQMKPNMHHGHGEAVIGLTEILAFVGVGGVFLALTSFFLTRAPLVPVKDPMLHLSMRYEDV